MGELWLFPMFRDGFFVCLVDCAGCVLLCCQLPRVIPNLLLQCELLRSVCRHFFECCVELRADLVLFEFCSVAFHPGDHCGSFHDLYPSVVRCQLVLEVR